MANFKPIYLDSNGVQRPATSSDNLQTGTLQLTGSVTTSGVLSTDASGNVSSAKLVNANVSDSAAIAYSKLSLGTSIQNSDVSTSAAIAYSKLNLGSSIVNNDVSSSAAIAYSKLNLGGSIGDSDISGSSNIALYNAASPSFTNKLGVGSVTDSDTTKAARVDYVISKVNAAIAGLDYKQEARWIINADGLSKYTLLKAINGTLDFPDASPKSISTIGDDGSGKLKVTTTTAHGYTTGNKIRIRDVTHTGGTVNNLAYNVTSGTSFAWTITVVDSDEFTLDGSSSTGFTYTSGGTAVITALLPAESGVFTAGDRITLSLGTFVDTGIYTVGGSSGSRTLTRASDMDTGSDAAGAYVYNQTEYDPSEGTTADYKQALVIQQAKGSAVVGTNALSFAVYGAGANYTFDAPLSESSGTVSLSINSDTLEVASNALKVSGLPLGFKINASAVSSNFTKTNADKLVDGTSGDASALHRHDVTLFPYVNASTQTVGKAVTVSAGNTAYASKTDGKVWGIIRSDAGSGQPIIATSGVAQITTPAGSPSVMDNLYLTTTGDLGTYDQLSANDYVTKVGKYLGPAGPGGTPLIAISIQEFGIKP